MGTEKMKVTQARMNLAAKARERPDQVKQVIQTLKEQGFGPTVRKIQERLRTPTTLGYSCAGVVAGGRFTDRGVSRRRSRRLHWRGRCHACGIQRCTAHPGSARAPERKS